jgi:hypothetical protein
MDLEAHFRVCRRAIRWGSDARRLFIRQFWVTGHGCSGALDQGASEPLHVSPSPISRQIAKIEHELRTQIFDQIRHRPARRQSRCSPRRRSRLCPWASRTTVCSTVKRVRREWPAVATLTALSDQQPVKRPVEAQSFRVDWPRSLSLRACSQPIAGTAPVGACRRSVPAPSPFRGLRKDI